ncbi:DnaJ C-terminal domain-containing protein [Almyronema epifaneia]|uniref:DnaJ C-terminal domain-containing protein n=1 Tax=Almyronema epifaneia S1 TaxID=2991925 RepID=A0ABW6IHZ3_9CYAN
MQNFRNYYEILEVSKEASTEEIKRAYRRLARQYHPDMNPGDKLAEERFKQLGEAYEVLSDSERRSQYEEFSSFWKQKGFRGRKGSNGRGGLSLEDLDFGEFRDFNSFVDQLLNRRREASNGKASPRSRPVTEDPYRPAKTKTAYTVQTKSSRRDAEASLSLPLEKAYTGGRERVRLEDGRSLEVDMPAGMITGQRIRLKGQGIGGGNLYLRIEVQPHPFFKLQGDHIVCRIPTTPAEAALGGVIEVPTLDGLVKMNIPAGVQPGQRLRLAGKGYPVGQNRRGDQIVQIEIVVPSRLSDRERELYAELRRTETLNPRADLPV